MSQESQTPLGDNPNSQAPTMDELEEIYRKQPDSTVNNITFQTERVANLEIKKLYSAADDITRARAHRLNTHFFTHAEHQQNFVGSVTKVIFGKPLSLKRPEPLTEEVLMEQESEVGATIFGPIARNEFQRAFFYQKRIADRDSWFFHQAITDSTGHKDVTIHYEVHPTGVLRISSHPDTKNEFIKDGEHDNFSAAVEEYRVRVLDQVYSNETYPSKKAA
ncbi:MAG TPA: hypothetical protein VMR16_00820 [Candidatus Saccharimonadales bacterium]|nr:hypothetical protein [Candidatus Saccharimonadales bacterium]